MKLIKLNKKDVLGKYDVKVDIKKSELACTDCLPISSLDGHPSLNGVLIHSRIDCPPDMLYMINEYTFYEK